MAMKIEKRKTIENGIYEELAKKHPVRSEKGVCYVQSMDYITLEVEEFNNPVFRKLVKQDSKYLLVYLYLRERMCHVGWHILWDSDTKEDITERLTLWGVSDEESITLIDTLIEKKIVRVFQHDGAEYLTDTQQIYNWEMLQARRARDRKSKQKSRGTVSPADNEPEQAYMPPLDYYTDNPFYSNEDEIPFT